MGNAIYRVCDGINASHSFIKYFPKIRSLTGCEKATVIAGRLEFWFNKYDTGFYKFLEPCSHRLYRSGDSWSEELGWSRKIFNRAFDLIGIRYKSKSEFLVSDDKFQGKLYASYHDRKTNRTYFVRNHIVANEFFGSGAGESRKEVAASQSASGSGTRIADITPIKTRAAGSARVPVNTRTGNTNTGSDHSLDSVKRAVPGTANSGRSYNNNLIQKKTSSLGDTQTNTAVVKPDDFEAKTEGMILIWKEEVGDLGVQSVSKVLLNRLYQSLSHFFSGSLEVWRSFCRKISSSRFLMGEAKNRFFKKAWITWAIKQESIELIHAGHFNCGDREIPKSPDRIQLEHRIQAVQAEKEKIELAKSRAEDEIRQKRREKVKSRLAIMPPEEMQQERAAFEEEMHHQDTITAQDFRERGWKMPFAETLFEMWMISKVESQLHALSLEEEVLRSLAGWGLEEKLERLNVQEGELIARQHVLNEAEAHSGSLGKVLAAATNLNCTREGGMSVQAEQGVGKVA